MKARFLIENVVDAIPTYATECTFTQRGGLIGSGDDNTWQLESASKPLDETIARVVVIDDHFTIEAVADTSIKVNGARAPLPKGRPIILSDKDSLLFNDLSIQVQIGSFEGQGATKTSNFVDMVNGAESADETLIADGAVFHEERVERIDHTEVLDPLSAMDTAKGAPTSADPLAAFKPLRGGDDRIADFAEAGPAGEVMTTAPDHSDMHFASMPTKNVVTDEYGFEDMSSDAGGTGRDIQAVTLEVDTPVDHIALRPLARRLGVPLGDLTTQQADRMLGDIGAAMRNAIEGLTKIYKQRPKGHGNFPVATMHMHAVEDNPLRFARDTDTAMHTLFAKRGPVHLSAPAAVKESMDHLLAHQAATEQAVDTALESVLKSLRPKALERRFASYDHDDIPEDREAYDAWCWRMYKAYFSELKSERQQGLRLLFWDMFEHEYSSQMRGSQIAAFDEDDD